MLRDSIADDMRAAMKAREQTRVDALRMLMTSVRNAEVEKRHDLSDEEVLEVVGREAKRRRESIEAFTGAGREELASKERAELDVLEGYLPAVLSRAEVEAYVDEAIAESGATTPKEMGLVMKALMPKLRGRADGAVVSAIVKERLGA